jgi:hypothetical protein
MYYVRSDILAHHPPSPILASRDDCLMKQTVRVGTTHCGDEANGLWGATVDVYMRQRSVVEQGG